jgi:hypothetical protein
MASPKLKLVAASEERPMKRVQRLQDEARAIAMAQVQEFETALAQLAADARELADAGEMVPAGVRELCRSFAEDADVRAKSLGALAIRTAARQVGSPAKGEEGLSPPGA